MPDKKKNYVYSDKGANLSIFKIRAGHCFCCGELFAKSGDLKETDHHAIPEYLTPIRNIVLPICVSCHKQIHNGPSNIDSNKRKMLKKLKGLKNQSQELDKNFSDMITDLESKEIKEEDKNDKEGG